MNLIYKFKPRMCVGKGQKYSVHKKIESKQKLGQCIWYSNQAMSQMIWGLNLGGVSHVFCSPKHPAWLGAKLPGHEVDHSPSSSTEVKNEWCYVPTPPVCLHGMHWDNFC